MISNKNTLELQDKAHDFLSQSLQELRRKQVKLDNHWHIDHICYRTSSLEEYILAKEKFQRIGQLILESEVNGRPIATFKLHKAIHAMGWKVDVIEVPAPKKGKPTKDGFEHFEVVCDLGFDEIKTKYSDLPFDESGLAKDFNQEFEILLEGFAVKFHHISLESVINLESNHRVFTALTRSRILSTLKPFAPLIAGTFPLNLGFSESDIDILISGSNLDLIQQLLYSNFGHLPCFECSDSIVGGDGIAGGSRTVSASFSFDGVSFDVFAQQTPSVRQRGYLHFLIEERLLKLGGLSFANKIKEARSEGLKTEIAFAKVLGLVGDAYEAMLELQTASNQELAIRLARISGINPV